MICFHLHFVQLSVQWIGIVCCLVLTYLFTTYLRIQCAHICVHSPFSIIFIYADRVSIICGLAHKYILYKCIANLSAWVYVYRFPVAVEFEENWTWTWHDTASHDARPMLHLHTISTSMRVRTTKNETTWEEMPVREIWYKRINSVVTSR